MDIGKILLTENECYKYGQTIKPIGIVVHSTGANNPELRRYIGPDDGIIGKNLYNNHWNQFRPSGRQVCVHGFIGKDKNGKVRTYQTLPWNMRGWHAGSGKRGSANDGYIGFEICEDSTNNKAYAVETYNMAVELCAYLAELYPAIKYENIIGHYEAAARGIASNHVDPQHWWKKHNLSMDQFRKDVRSKVEAETKPKPEPEAGDTYTVIKGDNPWTIAVKLLGDGRRYKEIEKLNGLSGDYDIYEGQILKMPTGSAPAPAPKLTTYQVTARAGLNYRASPSASGRKLGAFNFGQKVEIEKQQSGWGYVPAVKGWISMQYVKKV